MPDSPTSPTPWAPPQELPEHPYRFVPAPRRRGRRDGWSSDRQHAFVWALSRLPSVVKAAASVGMSARSAYRLREAPGAEAFAQAWDDAMEIGIDRARDAGLERAVQGVVVPIVHRGRIVGERRVYNDRLLGAVLGHLALEQSGLVAHRNAIRYRRQIRDADKRLNGPIGADDIARRKAEVDGMSDWDLVVEAERLRTLEEKWAFLHRHEDEVPPRPVDWRPDWGAQ